MGEAKRRTAEIAELKQTPKPRLRVKWRTVPVKTEQAFHFKNEAARRQVDPLFLDAPLINATATTRAVQLGQVEPKLVTPVEVKVRTVQQFPMAARQPKPPVPVVLVTGRDLGAEEFAVHVQAMAHIATADPRRHERARKREVRAYDVGCGFRSPSAKPRNWRSTSLVEQASVAAGLAPARGFEPSQRGEKKHAARQQTKALIHLERLIRENPTKVAVAQASLADGDDHAARWFFGKVMAAINGDIEPQWLETAVSEKLRAGLNRKYLNSGGRHRRMFALLKGDAEARQRGENLDGSPRRETVMIDAPGDAMQEAA